MQALLVLFFAAVTSAFQVPSRAGVVMMADKPNNTPAKYAPKGPFGGYTAPGDSSGGWLGDQSKSTQVAKFEKGEDFLFFQGPAPKTAVQDDLPPLGSDLQFYGLPQIAVTVTGAGSAVALLALLAQGA